MSKHLTEIDEHIPRQFSFGLPPIIATTHTTIAAGMEAGREAEGLAVSDMGESNVGTLQSRLGEMETELTRRIESVEREIHRVSVFVELVLSGMEGEVERQRLAEEAEAEARRKQDEEEREKVKAEMREIE